VYTVLVHKKKLLNHAYKHIPPCCFRR